MAKAIQELDGLTVGFAKLQRIGEGVQSRRGSVKQTVYDGDTVTVEAAGNLGVRFLGVDAPESKIPLPGSDPDRPTFTSLADPRWEQVLTDPFADTLPPFDPPLDADLQAVLAARCGPGTAANHARLAKAATDALEDLVDADIAELGQDKETFAFFIAFAHEVMDRYGRLLGFLNRNQPKANDPAPRPRPYNERLLTAGWVIPYFIWPNVDPFRPAGSLLDAVPLPGTAAEAGQQGALGSARRAVRAVRDAHLGLWDADDPLRVLPFELRFLSERRRPSRWVIDLSREDDLLLPPQAYPTIANLEDRLFVPAEFVPLFVEQGWRRGEERPILAVTRA